MLTFDFTLKKKYFTKFNFKSWWQNYLLKVIIGFKSGELAEQYVIYSTK